MNRNQVGKKADAGSEFNHYDLDDSPYEGKLAAYALGRLLKRLEWHLEQSVTLFAEISCPHSLGSHSSRSEVPDAAALSLIIDAVRCEAEAQFDFCRQIIEQLPSIAQGFEIRSQAIRTIALYCKRLQKPFAEDFRFNAIDLANKLRSRREDPSFGPERSCELECFVRKYCSAAHAQLHDFMLAELVEGLRRYFQLGISIERVLCPDAVFEKMAPDDCDAMEFATQWEGDDIFEGVVFSAGFVLGYRSFSPGSLCFDRQTARRLRADLKTCGIWNEAIRSKLVLPKKNAETNGPFGDIGMEEYELEVESLTGEVSPPSDSPPSRFVCRLPSSLEIEERVVDLHENVVQLVCKSSLSVAIDDDRSGLRESIAGVGKLPMAAQASSDRSSARDEVSESLASEVESSSIKKAGFLGGTELQNALGVDSDRAAAFTKQLDRKRNSLPSEVWIEVKERDANGPTYLYRSDAPEIRKIADRYKPSRS